VFRYVDLKPRVDENFFFSIDDPQFQTDQMINKLFFQEPEIILSAAGDVRSPVYLGRVEKLTDELSKIPGVDTVQSLTKGPRKPRIAS
ncbi:MAG TPA: hypothetical protein VLD55_04955, partial [Candidatus Sulfobium mesophilum]|nr:hypothetical protein [Candidatus Sulfobium mesophilum]